MAGLRHTFLSQHPLHDTSLHATRLTEALSALQGLNHPWVETTTALGVEALERIEDLCREVSWSELPQRVVHGDPKISNVLFDEEAVGLVDLDTCARHSVLTDLGDAVRSWTPSGDEQDVGRFRIEIFKALLQGYRASSAALAEVEIQRLAFAGPLITWELCARFLWDVVEDSYFGWDPERFESRRAHNLKRAKSMAALGRQMDAKRSALEEVVAEVF